MTEGTSRSIRKVALALVAGFLILTAGVSLAQSVQSGNVYGRVADEQGAPLPGVTVTLSGVGPTVTSVTGTTGDYRFLNLAPGTYSITHSLQGFATVNRGNVTVNVGKNTELDIRMKLSGVAEQVTVTGEVPLLDTRRTTTPRDGAATDRLYAADLGKYAPVWCLTHAPAV